MTISPNITSEYFHIDGTKIRVRLVRPEDLILTSDFANRLNEESKRFHFLGGFHQLSESELATLCDETSNDAIGIVALVEQDGKDAEIGAARYIKNQITLSHEMEVTVSDQFKRTRLARELVNFLVLHAKRHQVQSLYMKDMDSNVDMRNLADELKMSVRLDPADSHQVVYSLNVDEHQGTVVL